MAIMDSRAARAVLARALTHSKADACHLTLEGQVGGNIRYALNTVTTSGEQENVTLTVRSSFGKRSGVATVNELDDASLAAAVRRSEELARLAPEDPEHLPPLGPQEYVESVAWYDATAGITAEHRAEAALHGIRPSRAQELVAAGFLEHRAGFSAILNSAGLFAYHRATGVDFSATVRTADDTGSGWVSRAVNDVARLDTAAASQIAIDKAVRSREPREVAPGRYTVILEPAAVRGLLQPMIGAFDARQADEGRSFLAKPGGDTRLGERIVDPRVTLFSDPGHPEVPASPWADDGRPRRRTAWIENGVVRNLHSSRYWAASTEREDIPPPANSILEGGDATVEELVAATERGILVTRFWYIRSVDPQTLLFTGLTRDGTFLVEDGRIAYPIKNLRFNESPVAMLSQIEALGRQERVGGSLLPALKVRDFTFTSLSDAV
jgi:predicted Zn-dependent protease